MRQRTTFFHRPESPVDPALLQLADATLAGPTIDAAREDRITLSLDEVPDALARLLAAAVQGLHVRWAGPAAVPELVSPLLSRISPGLHVFYTPRPHAAQQDQDAVCSVLSSAFGQGVDCKSTSTSFNALGDDRLAQPDAFQFYAAVEDLSGFAAYVKTAWCASSADASGCVRQADGLDGASALDVSYDAASQTLRVTTQWPLGRRPLSVTGLAGARTEVGVMAADAPRTLGPHEIGMGGHVAVLGQDARAKPVMFAFPSRHRTAPGGASFSTAFGQPTGLHPTLQLRIADPGPPPPRDDGVCRLHAYLTLPRHIFADRYQLGDALFLASKNITALRHMTQPVDLEAPAYAVSVWGSAALLELAPPRAGADWAAEIPLHLRYLLPAEGGYRTAHVPYPAVFWACAADKDTQFDNNPFDRKHVGYDALFDAATEFWHLTPDPAGAGAPAPRLTIPVRVPVLDAGQSQWVDTGTSAAILLGFGWVLWKLASVYLRTGYGRAPPAGDSKSTKKTQ